LAAVSQPWHRGACCPTPGRLDPSLNEFWENPWDIVKKGHNLSAYERKRAFLNLRGRAFLDISALTGADGDGDGRCVVAGDFRNNGQLDLVLRQAGGGPVLLYENRFPRRHYLEVSLRGRSSNRLGIGARLTAVVRGQSLVRELYPLNCFSSQMPSMVHFGLGEETKVEQLTIRWPSGREQRLTNLTADRHIVVDEAKEGEAAVATVVPGQTIAPE
jgi:hypothetical protein